MTRRTAHNRIAAGVTFVYFAVVLGCFFMERSLFGILVASGTYLAILLIYMAVCWFQVPRHLRRRPEVPAVYRVFRIGSPSSAAVAALDAATIEKEGVHRKVRHQLFLLEENFLEGVWRCYVEMAEDRIVAHAIHFLSAESPVLDKGEIQGTGLFLDAEYQTWSVDKLDTQRSLR